MGAPCAGRSQPARPPAEIAPRIREVSGAAGGFWSGGPALHRARAEDRRFSLEMRRRLAQTRGVVAAGDSFLATQIAFLVISGVSVVVLVGGGLWPMVRSARALGAYGRTVLKPMLAGRWVSRKYKALPFAAATRRCPSGSLVRLRGRVEAETVQRAEFSGLPSVVCRHEFGEVGGGGAGDGFSRERLRPAPRGRQRRARAGLRRRRPASVLALVDRQPQRWHDGGPARAGSGSRGWRRATRWRSSAGCSRSSTLASPASATGSPPSAGPCGPARKGCSSASSPAPPPCGGWPGQPDAA